MNPDIKHMARVTNTSNPLSNLLAQRYTPPFRHPLPSRTEAMLRAEGFLKKQKKNFKLLKRWLLFNASGQSNLLRDRLPPPPARILWLNLGNDRIGDAIMDLSGRALLGAFEVDLLTARSQAEMFSTDRHFRKVFTDPGSVDPSGYDFALLDYINTRSLLFKRKWLPALPFASIYGLFHVPEINRTLFSCYRIHHLLGYPHPEDELRPFLSPRLFVEDEPCPLPAKTGLKRVALTLGGMAPFKTYRHWPEVIRWLRKQWPAERPFPEFVLIGSQNGLPYVKPVKAELEGCRTISLVGGLSLRATARAISGCDFYIGADGGLAHCANALKLPGVVIFGNRVTPEVALCPNTSIKTLRNPRGVNHLPPRAVAEKIWAEWERWHG